MKNLVIIFMLVFSIEQSWAQSISRKVISSAGGTMTGGGNMLTYNIGETAVHTLTAGGNMLTQGFQQPSEQITTGTVSTFLCAGSVVSVPFSAIDIGGGNTFTAQLSDATGSFASPVNIGTLAGNASGSIGATIPLATPAGSGYRIRVVSSFPSVDGNDNGSNLTITVAPAATISGNSSICLNSSATVVLNFTGSPPWAYTLSAAGQPNVTGSTSNNPENVSIVPATSGTHNYTVTILSDANCNGTGNGTATVIVSSAPPANSVSNVGGTTGACTGTVTLMTANIVTGQNIRYSWNTGSNSSVVKFSTNIGGPFVNGPFETTASSVYAQFGALAGGSSGYNICVQGTNGCGSTNNKCTWVRGIVSPPSTVNGSAIVCSGAISVAYNVPAVPSATLYTWSFPGATITGQGTQSVTIDFPAFTTGSLCVTAALSCGGSSTSAPKCMAISNATANPGAMNGPNKICPGQTGVVYSIPAIAGASTYNWTVPAGATITANTGPSITVSWPNPYTLNQSVCVTATSVCGAISAARCKSVSSGIPSTPGYIGGQSAGVCGQTIVYSVALVTGATSYTWVVPAGGTINSGQGTNSINVTWGLVTTLQMSVTANSACGSSGPRTLNITGAPATPGTISQLPAVVCNGGPANFSITAVAGATGYIWTVPANGTSIDNGQGTTSIDVTWGTGTGTITVKATNACGNSNLRSLTVTPGCRLEAAAVTSTNIIVYPNPAHDKVTVSIYLKGKTSFILQLRDMTGRIILSENLSGAAGLNTYDFNLTHLSKGIYMLEAESSAYNWKTKVAVE